MLYISRLIMFFDFEKFLQFVNIKSREKNQKLFALRSLTGI